MPFNVHDQDLRRGTWAFFFLGMSIDWSVQLGLARLWARAEAKQEWCYQMITFDLAIYSPKSNGSLDGVLG